MHRSKRPYIGLICIEKAGLYVFVYNVDPRQIKHLVYVDSSETSHAPNIRQKYRSSTL